MSLKVKIAFAIVFLLLAASILTNLRSSPGFPPQEAKEPFVDSFSEPHRVFLDGYDGDAMEPCISGDGKYLLFNNSNAHDVETHIHFAKRKDNDHFEYLGKLPGTVSGEKDMAPSLDKNGDVYFTSLRTYMTDRKSIYKGHFDGSKVDSVAAVGGDISPDELGWLNMDCGINSGADLLILARAGFSMGEYFPWQSDLMICNKSENGFTVDPRSKDLMANVTTPALEYAPSISPDGLTLYFTRAQELLVGTESKGTLVRILVSTRRSKDEPFGKPSVIRSISGFVEAPTLTEDGKEMFFHKKDGEKYVIYSATSKNQSQL